MARSMTTQPKKAREHKARATLEGGLSTKDRLWGTACLSGQPAKISSHPVTNSLYPVVHIYGTMLGSIGRIELGPLPPTTSLNSQWHRVVKCEVILPGHRPYHNANHPSTGAWDRELNCVQRDQAAKVVAILTCS
ncbi:hypothetical protein N7451_012248 [Penicillium sp. IBT 35674x]|nr:hypothetical protein N7451_012248 [Penicillium sp. IBT 35674x]